MQTDFLDGLKTTVFDFHSAGVMPPNKKSPQKCGLFLFVHMTFILLQTHDVLSSFVLGVDGEDLSGKLLGSEMARDS